MVLVAGARREAGVGAAGGVGCSAVGDLRDGSVGGDAVDEESGFVGEGFGPVDA